MRFGVPAEVSDVTRNGDGNLSSPYSRPLGLCIQEPFRSEVFRLRFPDIFHDDHERVAVVRRHCLPGLRFSEPRGLRNLTSPNHRGVHEVTCRLHLLSEIKRILRNWSFFLGGGSVLPLVEQIDVVICNLRKAQRRFAAFPDRAGLASRGNSRNHRSAFQPLQRIRAKVNRTTLVGKQLHGILGSMPFQVDLPSNTTHPAHVGKLGDAMPPPGEVAPGGTPVLAPAKIAHQGA